MVRKKINMISVNRADLQCVQKKSARMEKKIKLFDLESYFVVLIPMRFFRNCDGCSEHSMLSDRKNHVKKAADVC